MRDRDGRWDQIYRTNPKISEIWFPTKSKFAPQQVIVRLVEILRKQVGGSGGSETIWEDSGGWDYHWEWNDNGGLMLELDFEELWGLIDQDPELKSMMTLHKMRGECDAGI